MVQQVKKRAMQPVVQQIVIRPPQRKTSDVGQWRTALLGADMGRMKLLYDLYEDLLIDGVLADAVSKRIDAVTNSPLTFQDASGQEVPELTELIDSPDFEQLLTTIMDARFWGRAAGEFDFSDGFVFSPIPFKHIKLENHNILLQEYDDTGRDYLGDDFILVLGKPRQFGLFLKTAPYAIWKRGGFGDYAQWIELFGMPQRVGKYSSYDPESRRLLVEAMEQAGSAPWIVIPKESDVETVNNTGNGSSSSAHNDFRKACNEEMLITILGQTMTTLDGSSRSQSETHKEVEEGKNRSDLRYVRRVLNWIVLPLLEKRGFPVAGGKFIFPEAAEPLTVTDLVSLSDIIDIPASYVHDKFSIPVPKDGEQLAKKQASPNPPVGGENQPAPGKPAKSDKEEVKLHDQLSRWERIVDFFVNAPALTGAVKQQNFIGRLTSSITGNIKLSDGYTINIAKLVDEALREIYNEPDKGLVNPSLFNITNNALQQAISIEVNQEDDKWGKTNSAFIQQFRENTAVFAAFKSHQQQNEIVDLLVDEKGELRSFAKFKKLALEVSKDYDINWLRTEYNTAVRSARAAINFRKYLETEHLYPNLEYLESTAEHKRGDHLEYVGTILPIRHAWWNIHLPPSKWNCQCSVRPTNKPATPVPGETEPVDPVFANNPGQTAKFVNTEETPYYQHTDEGLREQVAELGKQLEKLRQSLEDFKLYKEFANGGKLYLHNKLDKKASDYKMLVTTGTEFAKQGKEVQVVAKLYYDKRGINDSSEYLRVFEKLVGTTYEGKSPDLVVDGVFYELKSYERPFRFGKIQHMLSNGLKQSSRIIIDNSNGASDRGITEKINGLLKNKATIDEVWLYEKGHLRLFYKAQQGD